MSDNEDPYAVSSDEEEDVKKPPPKIQIEGKTSNIKELKAAITESKESGKDEKRLEEIEEIRKAKAAEMAKMKKEFEEGKVHNADKKEDEAKPSGLNKETLSAFKSKFEKFHQNENETLDDHLKTIALEGVGKENMSQMKEAFEKVQKGELSLSDLQEGKGVDLNCSEADKRRIMAAFIGPKSEEDIPKNCALCDKIVYPVERLFANKQLYHQDCFRCKICNKKLNPTQYNIHENNLYCKPHYIEVLHPERTHTAANQEAENSEEEEDEYAIVSKPKQLSSDVVRAGTNISEELQQIRSLKEKKESWQSSVRAHDQVGKKNDDVLESITGKVKDRMSKIIAGGDKSDDEDENKDEKEKQLEAIKAQVGEVKNKWKTGEVEKAEAREADSRNELEELRKGGINVRERFNEKLNPSESENVSKSYDRNELDTSSLKSFLEGHAYQSGPVEKTATDLHDIQFKGLTDFKSKFEKGEEESSDRNQRQTLDINVQLNSIKQNLEKGGIDESDMTPEDRAEMKKKEIEAEFLRYKLARKLQAKKAQEAAPEEESETSGEKPGLDVEVKMAGKAREKFKNIEAQNPNSVPMPKATASSKTSKWDKKENTAEVVNRRMVDESSSGDEDENAYDIKNLMNKFKNIQAADTKVEKTNLEELEALRQQAKNLRQQFEQKTDIYDEQSEEKRKELAEEFQRLKEERAKMQEELKTEEFDRKAHREIEKEEVQVAADHASKMAAKWEKINKKEAKKAEKSKMPTKST
ncbi:hypothetical protein FO519_002110 [Halicephalobus sp. NKZ332]|nr:hypothetical protein FO519_002110 [Halicephalobus sp. NKZ332]